MKKILFGIYFLVLTLLIMTLLEFIYLDKKLTKAIEKQLNTNTEVQATLQEQAKSLRVLTTDCLVLTNIVTSEDYCAMHE